MLKKQNTHITRLAAALGVLCAAVAAVPAAQAATTLRLSTYVNENDVRFDGFKKFAELVAEKTDGRVQVKIFPSSTLHGWSEGVDAIVGGVADISWISADTRLPCYRVTSLYPATVDMSKQIEMDAQYSTLMQDEAVKAGLMPLLNSNYSYDQEWWFKNPVTQIDKIDGKLVRSVGPLVSLMIESWGGKPVFVAPKEVFQSAERGVVDGINMGVATYSSWKLWNVMPHMVKAGLFYGNIQYMVNKKKFDSLSPEDQQAVASAARESEDWLKPRYEQWVDERVGNAVMQGGGSATALPLDQRKALLKSITTKWDAEVEGACGAEVATKVRQLFANHSL